MSDAPDPTPTTKTQRVCSTCNNFENRVCVYPTKEPDAQSIYKLQLNVFPSVREHDYCEFWKERV